MPKISLLPNQPSPASTDKVPVVSGSTTTYETLADLITFFFNNIPAGAHSDVTRGSETIFDHVASGGVWTADSVGVNRNASMTAMVVYINGRRISVSAVTARTFVASVDTYIDVLDNLDGTGTLVYTTAVNNAASATLAANSVRVGIIVTGATTIAATSSINQGQEDRVLPIASSIPYAVTDSIGNLICPRDPSRKLLGYRQIVANFSSGTTVETVVTGLTVPVKIPTGRKIIARAFAASITTTGTATLLIRNGTTTAGTQIAQGNMSSSTSLIAAEAVTSAFTGSQSFVCTDASTAGNPVIGASATQPCNMRIELY